MSQLLCWFTTTLKMRAGQSGRITIGPNKLQYGPEERLDIFESMGHSIRTSVARIHGEDAAPLPTSTSAPKEFVRLGDDIDHPDYVMVTLPLVVDGSFIPAFPK